MLSGSWRVGRFGRTVPKVREGTAAVTVLQLRNIVIQGGEIPTTSFLTKRRDFKKNKGGKNQGEKPAVKKRIKTAAGGKKGFAVDAKKAAVRERQEEVYGFGGCDGIKEKFSGAVLRCIICLASSSCGLQPARGDTSLLVQGALSSLAC